MLNDNIERPAAQQASEAVSLTYRALHRINFACAQNDIATIERLVIGNRTENPLTDVRITLRAAPPIIREKIWTVDRIAPEAEFEVRDLSFPLDIERLAGLNEAEICELEIRVEVQGLQTLVEKSRIELLARDEWGGVRDMAQILAAFVSPNDPVIADVLKEAARLLEAAGHDGSLNGYQSGDASRAYLLAGAIWSAATGMGLTYAQPPASFEREGQKVRSPDRIKNEGLATCLDSALFLAAAFEATGLHPVVLFSRGHAWVGVWICKSDFGRVTEPDVVAVRKAVQAHEFIPIETTLLTQRPSIGFDQAVDEGRRRLSEDREPEFVMAVDIARSRVARIRPLASHKVSDPSDSAAVDEVAPAALPPLPDFAFLAPEIVEEVPKTSRDRIDRWKNKLLDLSLRNRLLNFRDSKQTLPLRCLDVGALEDALAAGKKFRGLSLTDEDPVGNRSVSPEETQRIEEGVVRDAFERGQVAVPLTGRDMNSRFLTLYRRARSDMQEGGTNTLFLAAGFLRWKKTKGDTRTYRAPLLLVPVKLERRSAQSAYRIAHHEDDVQINATLLEFLKRDFALPVPELDGELPRDESGIDVPLIFEIMRRKVRDVAVFQVVEELALSTFSFAKYLMWKDLVDRTDQLRTNRLVAHLIDGSEQAYGESGDHPPVAPGEIDRRRAPREWLTPLPADSSQLAAVLAASEGRDFILVGPPGTGKSQTITNIIAQCLGEGKTVLFVAEKAAALDVVHRRLVTSGLGDAVLDLHSNKADKKSVIAQLGRGWDRASSSSEAPWIEVTDKLRVFRDWLNAYAAALHVKGSQGFSVFDALGRVASGEAPFELSFASKDAHDEQSYKHLVTLAAELGRTHEAVGDGPALSLIRSDDWSFQWEADILGAAQALRGTLDDLKRAEHRLARELGLRPDPNIEGPRRARLKALAPRAALGALDLSSVPDMTSERLVAEAEAFVTDVRGLAAAISETVATYSLDAIRRMPLKQMDTDWREAQTKYWPASAFARRKVRKLLQTYADNGAADPAVDLKALFKMYERYSAIRRSAVAPVAQARGSLDAGRVTNAVCQAVEFRSVLADLRSEAEDLVRFESATSQLVSASRGGVLDALKDFLAAEEAAADKARAFALKGGAIADGMSVSDLAEGIETLMAQRARLPDWVVWIRESERACAEGLSPLVEALEAGTIEGAAEEAFERAYATWWLPLAMDASTALRRFTRRRHENAIAAYRKLDDAAARRAPTEVMRRIAHGLPARHGVPRKSELGVLRHQLGLTRPSLSIRALLESLPDTFGKLAPCVLMSPLSVAQYLPAGQASFDVVIFDEASQITTWDAIGAIARARQTIIVGDPKQLPPTNFFGRADDEDEDLPEVERDLPSILDEVSVAGVRPYHLKWHYRSRDEALIAFSNYFYYGGGLVTFPAPATGSGALKFHKVNGTYARGHGRVNEVEAKTIAATVKRRLTAWLAVPEAERHTLGVITFNAEQQSLILDLLDEMRRGDVRLEWFFADDREEPVIVKNLENIQGDERDVMLFSVTFGPDLAGKLTMNFGAINGKGGEKRLNVAITRARRELHVFSSIHSEQIDLARTHAVGVRDLKWFLDYAERGSVALPSRDEGSLGPAESPFEEAVANALRAKGWEVRTQIGVSGFRVDLGVVHPDYAGSYIAGVECDGAQYHSSATARDRDKVRQAVLEDLGWAILRIWSTDWFRDPAAVTECMHADLDRVLEDDREARAARAPEEQAQAEDEASAEEIEPTSPVVEVVPPGPEPARTDEVQGVEMGSEQARPHLVVDSGSTSRQSVRLPESAAGPSAAEASLSLEPEAQIASVAGRSSLFAREGARPTAEGFDADPNRFFDSEYSITLQRIILGIVEEEGPLPLHRLARRVAQQHGWQRTGRRIQGRVRDNLGTVELHTEFGTTFVWAPGSHADRVPFRSLDDRSIRDVSRAEIASVIDAHALELAEAEDPALALSRKLGISRLSKDARAYLSDCALWRVEERVAASVTLNWSARYERSKAHLVRRLEALAYLADSADFERAERLIAAVQLLPEVGESGGGLRIEKRIAERPGDSDFIYSLFLSDDGFELGYQEIDLLPGGDRRFALSRTLVRCARLGCDEDDKNEDAEALSNMRRYVEMQTGRKFDDDEWKQQIEAASESPGADVPNGIERWLEMLPVDDDGDYPEYIIVQWSG